VALRRLFIIIIIFVSGRILMMLSHYAHENSSNYETSDIPPAPSREGLFKGRGEGFVGDVELEIYFLREFPDSPPRIKWIRTLRSDEVREYWKRVINELMPQVIEKQSTEVDILSGATESSRAFLRAVDDAMSKAYEEN